MRDRDRIIHSRAFRRLEYKTQVFVYHEGDHFRTRLTHTLEVAQISRTIARALRLNEDLAEAIALSHDLGHPPFGHSGERALAILMEFCGGFEHNVHTLRIVDHIERRYPAFRGLNLTFEVREAISKHAKKKDDPLLAEFSSFPSPSLEAQVVDVADSISYNAHDIDDGFSSGVIAIKNIGEIPLWNENFNAGETDDLKMNIYSAVRKIINSQVSDLINETEKNTESLGIKSVDDVRPLKKPIVRFSEEMRKKHAELKKFLREEMYQSYRVIRMEEKAFKVVSDLFTAYKNRPEILPPTVQEKIEDIGRERMICDYIAGMTDRFALEEHKKLFDPMARV